MFSGGLAVLAESPPGHGHPPPPAVGLSASAIFTPCLRAVGPRKCGCTVRGDAWPPWKRDARLITLTETVSADSAVKPGTGEAGPGPSAGRGAKEAGPGRQHGVMGCCVGPLLGGVWPPRGLLQLGGGKAVWRVSCEVYVSKYGKKCILNLFFVFNISA